MKHKAEFIRREDFVGDDFFEGGDFQITNSDTYLVSSHYQSMQMRNEKPHRRLVKT